MFGFLHGQKRNHGRTVKKAAKTYNRVSGESTREILSFQDREVHVRRQAYKRSIGLTLQVNGRIRVSAPKSTPLASIHEFLHANTEWIETHLQKYQQLRDAYPPKRYVAGEEFLLLGSSHRLAFVRGTGARWRMWARDGQLVCAVPPTEWTGFDVTAPHPELARMIHEYYSKAGKSVIESRLQMYSSRMGLFPSSVRYRSQKTRWGSCSAKGRISLNWRLIVAPLEVIDYVVVHELSHLKHYNHSDAFWSLVGTQIPGYATLRNWLRSHQYEADFLAKRSELHPL